MTLKGHEGAITHVGFSSLASNSSAPAPTRRPESGTWIRCGAAIRPLERSGSVCYVARFSPDGQLIAAADGTQTCGCGTPRRGNWCGELSAGGKGRVFSVAFSPTDNRLLAVGYGGQADVSYVALWDIDAGRELARLPGATDLPDFSLDENTGAVGALAFSPDGKYLVAGFGSPECLRDIMNFSQSAEGLGGRDAPTDPPLERTHGLLCFSRLLEGWGSTGQRQSRRNGDHLVDRDMESGADASKS